ncbi:MAG TPA: thioesterase family protein, partial [Thermohalobaculum sp.]|nr:thioesterase family protein [Thermohalobaculum sp.]
PPEWIDYNGHMNVAYYTMAFDNALDEVYAALGIGENLVRSHRMGPMALQSQLHYLGELVEGRRFACDFRLLDADAKRTHCFLEMIDLERDTVAATYETLSLNVDLEGRRSAPYPPESAARIERLFRAHESLPRPAQAGQAIGIRRKRP